MKQFRILALVSAVAAAFAGQALVGSAEQTSAAAQGNPLDSLYFRPIGPASMSGRIADVAVYEPNPSIFYVATAHGGVWKTTNNGTTFEAQLQDQGLMSFGDVTVSQHNPDLAWAGGGESNNRQSTSWGGGAYKTIDGGKTWASMGLRESRHIHRIVIDPRDNNIVFVAATGSLWGPGGERGVFKTTDGGKTWKRVLYVDEDTGASDIVQDATDNRVLYASTYQRRRSACCFNGGGPGSGIWKSTDAGETWTRLKGGVLDGPMGRIGLDVYRKNPQVLYAMIEGPQTPGGGRGGGGEQATGVNQQPTGLYKSTDAGATWTKVNNTNPRPMYFSKVRIDPNDPDVVYFGGVGLHQTLDGGKTIRTSAAARIHSDHHAIWVNPANSNHVLIGNDGGLAISYDKSQTWNFLPNLPVGLFYHVGYDMAIPYNVCGGMQDNYNWCGPSAVRGSAGIAGFHWKTLQGGDGFVVLQDPTDYRIAYSESQDGNMTRVDRVTGETISIRPVPPPGEQPYRWHWDTPMLLSPHNARTLYSAANKVFRSDDRGLSWTVISPDLTESPSRDTIVTMGVKGAEIRFSRNDGIQAWPTIVTLAESAKRPGLIYAGTDDGNVSVTRDGGRKWENVTAKIPGLPQGIYVSEVVPSRFVEGVVYATFDGHRQNDFKTHIYASSDFGQTWRPLNANLTDENARTLTEDTRNQDVLYLGTETGLFVSLDRGKQWQRIKANLPTVRIDEITLHPRDNAMILATHGRTIWILDHLEPIQEMAATLAANTDADLFTPPAFAWYQRPARDRNYEFWGDQTFYGQNPPQAARISWHLKKPAGSVALKITDAAGREVREISGPVLASSNKAGINIACWDLRVQPAPAFAGGAPQGGRQGGGGQGQGTQPAVDPFGAGCGSAGGGGGGGRGGGAGNTGPFVLPGTYNVSLLVDGKAVETKPLKVMADPEVVLTDAERKMMFDRAMELHDLQIRATEVATRLSPLNAQAQNVAKELETKADVPADVKAQFAAFNRELAAVVPKFITQGGGGQGGGGFGGGGAAPSPNVLTRIGQAKSGLMGGMLPTENTMKAYADAKTMTPPAIAEANAVLAKAPALSAALAKHGLKMDGPK